MHKERPIDDDFHTEDTEELFTITDKFDCPTPDHEEEDTGFDPYNRSPK